MEANQDGAGNIEKDDTQMMTGQAIRTAAQDMATQ